MDRFTFEVKNKDPQQPICHAVIRYNPALVFYALIKAGPDGSYKESETYGPNVSTFPPFFGDYTGAVYDLAADLKPLDSFWYLFVSMNPNGKTPE